MSVFSDTLTRYIEHKNIKVFSLAKYCNLDRSTMYKILNGKRNPPSSEVFEKMTQFMHLTPIEYNFLKETTGDHSGWTRYILHSKECRKFYLSVSGSACHRYHRKFLLTGSCI